MNISKQLTLLSVCLLLCQTTHSMEPTLQIKQKTKETKDGQLKASALFKWKCEKQPAQSIKKNRKCEKQAYQEAFSFAHAARSKYAGGKISTQEKLGTTNPNLRVKITTQCKKDNPEACQETINPFVSFARQYTAEQRSLSENDPYLAILLSHRE